MADEKIPDGIDVQGINFQLGADDTLSPALDRVGKKFDTVESALEKGAEDLTKKFKKETRDQVDSIYDVVEAFDDFGESFEETVSNLEGVLKRSSLDTSKARDQFISDVAKMDKAASFESISRQSRAMSQSISAAFKRSHIEGLQFVRENESTINRVIDEYKFMGKAVPHELEHSIEALNKYRAALEAAASPAIKKGLLGTVEDLWDRLKRISVRDTLLGAAAFGASSKLFSGTEQTYEIARQAARYGVGGKDLVQSRRSDVSQLRGQTGATLDDIEEINAQFSKMAYLGPMSFKSVGAAAVKLSRATGESLTVTTKHAAELQHYYGVSDAGLEDAIGKTAALAKLTGQSTDEVADLYHELRYVGFALGGNLSSAKGLADATALAAGKMAKYGISAQQVISDVKGVLEGGVSEYQKNLQTLIIGGMSPEEAMATLDGVASKSEEATKKFLAARNQAASNISAMAGGGAMGGAIANTIASDTLSMSGEERIKRTAAANGILDNTPSAKTIETLDKAPETWRQALAEFPTVSERAARAYEKIMAPLIQSHASMYDKALVVAERLETSTGNLAKTMLGMDPSKLQLLGVIGELTLGITMLRSLVLTAKTVFGIGEGTAATLGQATTKMTLMQRVGGFFGRFGGIDATGAGASTAEALGGTTAAKSGILARLSATGVRFGTIVGRGLVLGLQAVGIGAAIAASFGAGLIIGKKLNDWIDEFASKHTKFRKAWEGMWDWLAGIPDMAGRMWDKVTDRASASLTYVGATLTAAWMNISSTFETVWSGITNSVLKATNILKTGFNTVVDIARDTLKSMFPDWLVKLMGGKNGSTDYGPLTIKRASLSPPSTKILTPSSSSNSSLALQGGIPPVNPSIATPISKAPEGTSSTKRYPSSLNGLISLATDKGFTVTATTGGKHNPGSAHYAGRAIDVRTNGKKPEDIASFISEARSSGFSVKDERTPQKGVWSGPHIHVQLPGAGASAPVMTAAVPVKPSAAPGTSIGMPSVSASASPSVQTSAPTVIAKTEPFTGTTSGESGIIAELRKTNAMLARQIAVLTNNLRPGHRPSSELNGLNRIDMGG